jgi:flagellar hook-length control protein FliK
MPLPPVALIPAVAPASPAGPVAPLGAKRGGVETPFARVLGERRAASQARAEPARPSHGHRGEAARSDAARRESRSESARDASRDNVAASEPRDDRALERKAEGDGTRRAERTEPRRADGREGGSARSAHKRDESPRRPEDGLASSSDGAPGTSEGEPVNEASASRAAQARANAAAAWSRAAAGLAAANVVGASAVGTDGLSPDTSGLSTEEMQDAGAPDVDAAASSHSNALSEATPLAVPAPVTVATVALGMPTERGAHAGDPDVDNVDVVGAASGAAGGAAGVAGGASGGLNGNSGVVDAASGTSARASGVAEGAASSAAAERAAGEARGFERASRATAGDAQRAHATEPPSGAPPEALVAPASATPDAAGAFLDREAMRAAGSPSTASARSTAVLAQADLRGAANSIGVIDASTLAAHAGLPASSHSDASLRFGSARLQDANGAIESIAPATGFANALAASSSSAPASGAAATPPSMPTADVAGRFGTPAFAPSLAASVSVLARDGIQEARLNLHPAEMGPIAVQIAIEGTQARVDFTAEVAATRAAIESGLPELASALRESGLTLAGGGVYEQAREQREAQGGTQPQRGSSSRSDSGSGADTSNGATSAPLGAAARQRIAAGGVDTYA